MASRNLVKFIMFISVMFEGGADSSAASLHFHLKQNTMARRPRRTQGVSRPQGHQPKQGDMGRWQRLPPALRRTRGVVTVTTSTSGDGAEGQRPRRPTALCSYSMHRGTVEDSRKA